jgi:hypothetical protein
MRKAWWRVGLGGWSITTCQRFRPSGSSNDQMMSGVGRADFQDGRQRNEPGLMLVRVVLAEQQLGA